MNAPKPTAEALHAARNKSVSDLIAPDLRVLFVGINPGLYSGATGHHFARPGNRFWPALHAAGFTGRLLAPCEERELLLHGYGITNIVNRATAKADELEAHELHAGAQRLRRTVRRHRPRIVAVLGVGAYRAAFARPKAALGPQQERLGDTALWVLPNPSGLNANYQLSDLAALFKKLRLAAHKGD